MQTLLLKLAAEKAKTAMADVRSAIKAAAEGSDEAVLIAVKHAKMAAKEAVSVARMAASSAKRGAKEAAKIFVQVRKKVNEGYEIFLMIVRQIGIQKEGNDTYCSEMKRFFCRKASVHMHHVYFHSNLYFSSFFKAII